MATRTGRQSQTHMISIGYLNDTSQSLTLLAGLPQCRSGKISRPNDPSVNFPKMIYAKYVEIKDLINRGPFWVVLRAELLDGSSVKTARCFLSIKSNEEK